MTRAPGAHQRLLNFVGAYMHADVVDVPLEVDDGIFKLVDAVVEGGVSTVVVVQLSPKAFHHGNEPPKPLHESVLSLVQRERPPSGLAPGPAVCRGGEPGAHTALSRGGGLHRGRCRGNGPCREGMRRGRGRPCRRGPRAEPKRGDPRVARAARAVGRCGQLPEP